MNKHFTAFITRGTRHYSHLRVIATSDEEARQLVEQHLAERNPLGFSEAEMRRLNPRRTPWKPGLRIHFIMDGGPVGDGCKIGIVLENERDEGRGIPF